jgi:hypothetical protein
MVMEGNPVSRRKEIKMWLAAAEKQVTEAERYIVRQRETVAELGRVGGDTTAARNLLARLEEAQSRRLFRRDFLRREVELNGSSPS